MSDPYSPSRVFSYCPRCGSGKLVSDSPKSMKCPDCSMHWYFNMAAAVAGLIFDPEGRLLLTYRAHEPAKGMLDLPGGFVDMGETAEDALRREIREELNITIDHVEYKGSSPNLYLFEELTYQTLDLVFYCKVSDFGSIRPGDDVSGFTFLYPADIPLDEIGLASIRSIIESLLE